jgi:hypothetical protein
MPRFLPAALALNFLVKPTTGLNAVTATVNPDAMMMSDLIFNPGATGVTIKSAVFVGDVHNQMGNYTTANLFKDLPNKGVILSSGNVAGVREGVGISLGLNQGGDADLTTEVRKIDANYLTLDAAVLVIDVEVAADVDINVAYVFGSQEYPTPPDIDIFGLFLDGVNVALIGGEPVSTKTVYCDNNGLGSGGSKCDQYINNPSRLGSSLRGWTRTQILTLSLATGIRTVKVAVADGTRSTGRDLDSVVFLAFQPAPTKAPTRKPTMSPSQPPTMTPTQQPVMSPTRKPTMKPMQKPTMAPTQTPVMPSMPMPPMMMTMKMMPL